MKIFIPIIFIFGVFLSTNLSAEIITDGSMGPNLTLQGPDFQISQDLGRVAGNNLFHSFQTFSIEQNQSAVFTGSSDIANVISRVTGGEVSTINGVLSSTIGQADFFFLNPAGVIFGEHAQINVPAAFHVSTANELRFSDGVVYGAGDLQNSILSMAQPEAFGFLGNQTTDIQFNGSNLTLQGQNTLSVSAANINLNDTNIINESGTVRLITSDDPGSAVFFDNREQSTASGNVNFSDSQISVSGSNGNIFVMSQNLSIARQGNALSGIFNQASSSTNSGLVKIVLSGLLLLESSQINISALGDGNSANMQVTAQDIMISGRNSGLINKATSNGSAGTIELSLTGSLSLINGGQINLSVSGEGNGGVLLIEAQDITIDSQRGLRTGIFSDTSTTSSGDSGRIEIMAEGMLSLVQGGRIDVSTNAEGNAGNIQVTAHDMIIDSQGGVLSGIFNRAHQSASGDAGQIEISIIGMLSIINGGQIGASTRGDGDGGNVHISAHDIWIHHEGRIITGIFTQASSTSSGNAGSINISVGGLLSLLQGGLISAATFSQGNGGIISIAAEDILINGQGYDGFTGIVNQTVSSGNSGLIAINVNNLMSILNGGEISASTFSEGSAGSIQIVAQNMIIDGQNTGISNKANRGSTGDAGSIDIIVNELLLLMNDGQITSSTVSSGEGGNINIVAQDITLNALGASGLTGISSSTQSSGNAGAINLGAHGLLLLINGGRISTDSVFGSGNAGDINAQVNFLTLDHSSITTEATQSSAGAINVSAESIVLNNSNITTSVIGEQGNGGNISINANALALNTGFIQANTAASGARGGDIQINLPHLILVSNREHPIILGGNTRQQFIMGSGVNVIQAAAEEGISGNVSLSSPIQDVSNSLVQVKTDFDLTKIISRHPCKEKKGKIPSSLFLAGNGGLPVDARQVIGLSVSHSGSDVPCEPFSSL